MLLLLEYKDFKIEIFDDEAYVENSADSPTYYKRVYQSEKSEGYYCWSRHAIKIYSNTDIYQSAIILETAGATHVSSDTALVDGDNLIIRCSNKLYSLTLPDLKLNWVVEPDWATCFSIHRYKDSYIVHGECSISRIDKFGNILWDYGGADIFVSLYGGPEFKMNENDIELLDFNGGRYRIDYDGNTLSYEA